MSAIIHEERETPIDLRVLLFPLVVLLALGVFLVRLWYLQVAESEALAERAQRMRSTLVDRLAPRGLITDRNGKILAGVRNQMVIQATPGIIQKHPDSLTRTAKILGVEREELEKELREGYFRKNLPVAIYSRPTVLQATKILEMTDLPGIQVATQPMRFYPDSTHFAHVLGYVWTPSERDLKRIQEKGVEPAQFVGKIGLERTYEKELMGVTGKDTVYLDKSNRAQRMVTEQAAQPGGKMVLALDAALQRRAYELLDGREGSIVALDPRDFSVLLMANSPTYDTSPFLRGVTTREYRALMDSEAKPLVNRAIASFGMPGSTMKPIIALAAELQGINVKQTAYTCRGSLKLGPRARPIKCMGTHGTVGIDRAMAKSCNVYFMQLGLRVKREAIVKAAMHLGLGQKTGLDLSEELAGSLPTNEWLKAVSGDGEPRWMPGQTANISLGQGELNISPLQMAVATATIANGGRRYEPHFVRGFVDASGKLQPRKPELVETVPVSAESWQRIQGSMEEVMSGGTAAMAGRIQGLAWAGKTGSAQRRGQRKTDSWFIAYAPAENPTIAICVRVVGAGHGSEAAVPIARALVAQYLGFEKPPQKLPSASANPDANARPAAANRGSGDSANTAAAAAPNSSLRRASSPVSPGNGESNPSRTTGASRATVTAR